MSDAKLRSGATVIRCGAINSHARRVQEVPPAKIGAEIRAVFEFLDHRPRTDCVGHLEHSVFAA